MQQVTEISEYLAATDEVKRLQMRELVVELQTNELE